MKLKKDNAELNSEPVIFLFVSFFLFLFLLDVTAFCESLQ